MSVLDSLPNRALKTSEVEALENGDQITRIVRVLEFRGKVLSLVLEAGGKAYGLHCDHETAEWRKIASGDDFDEVLAEHEEWVDDDMERVTGI